MEVHINPIPTVINVAHFKSFNCQKDYLLYCNPTGRRIIYCIEILLAVGLPTVLKSYWQKDYLLYCNPTGRRIIYCIEILLAEGLPTVLQSYWQ
jgi:hypothetical protein